MVRLEIPKLGSFFEIMIPKWIFGTFVKGATTLRPKFFVLAESFFRDLSIWKSWISSFQRYQTCQYSYGKIVETIDLKIHGFILVQYIHHVFSNRLFQLFSYMKIDKFGIVGKRRFSSFIWRGLEKNFQPKQKISALG